MEIGDNLGARYERSREFLKARGQGHVLRWWSDLGATERDQLLSDIESIPWDTVDALIPTHVRASPPAVSASNIEPAKVLPSSPSTGQRAEYETARQTGRERLALGRVAALTVAGGQGTRLGLNGPKGAVAVTPVRGATLFQLFAEMILAAGRKHGVCIPWYVMTSPVNHVETDAFFEGHGFFSLPREQVFFFSQGVLPAFDVAGRMLLDERHRLALSPDGHGGVLRAMLRSGVLADLEARGIEVLSYFQIDNPLVQPFDPLFIGLHSATGSRMSTKVARKADDLERVGNVCLRDGRLTVIEYIDFPESCASARDADGRRRFDAGNLAIHLLDVGFIRRVTSQPLLLPYRRAEKVVAFVDDRGVRVTPTTPNAIKLETFIFDLLPQAKNPLVLGVDRGEEFSPVKNPTGVDSLETSKRDQIRRAARWVEAAGLSVPRGADGEPVAALEIAPSFALDAEDVAARRGEIPSLTGRSSLVLE